LGFLAPEKLQQIIFAEAKQGVAPTDKVTLNWFWENRFKAMREPRWETPTRDGCLYLYDKFLLRSHFKGLAEDGYSKWVVKRAKTQLSSVFIEAVEGKFMATNRWRG